LSSSVLLFDLNLELRTCKNVDTDTWEVAGEVPDSIYHKCAADGLLVPISFGRKIPAEYAHYPIIGGIKAEEWDGFHDFVLWDELYRGGAISSIFVGLTVGAPPLKQYASPALKAEMLPQILEGKKRICLAITEPVRQLHLINSSSGESWC
jgi:alkylation response protein AidB-like acyl-CoA dehydrogenase